MPEYATTPGAPRRPARICMLNFNAWSVIGDAAGGAARTGGEEVQHVLLSRYLAGRGYQVSALVGDFGQQTVEVHAGVAVRKTYAPDAGLPGLRFFTPRLSRTWAALAAADADVYYTSCAGPMAGLMAAFCRRRGRRFVFRIASDADCVPATVMLDNPRDRWLYHYGLRRAHAILAQTAHQAALLARHHGLPARLAGMLAELPRQVADGDARSIDLLWLANLRAMKRPACFLDLVRALAAEAPQLRYVMAGGPHHAEPALYARTEAAAQALPQLRFHGPVRSSETAALFAQARLFVNTSSFEGFPNTYLQAWANGVPVIATFDPDGIIASHGLGIAVLDLAHARAAVLGLLNDRAAWAACSARCRAYAAARLAPDLVCAPYLAAMVPQ